MCVDIYYYTALGLHLLKRNEQLRQSEDRSQGTDLMTYPATNYARTCESLSAIVRQMLLSTYVFSVLFPGAYSLMVFCWSVTISDSEPRTFVSTYPQLLGYVHPVWLTSFTLDNQDP